MMEEETLIIAENMFYTGLHDRYDFYAFWDGLIEKTHTILGKIN